MKKAIYAGSFDPFTNGHHSIAERALNIFDELHIIIAVSPSKHGLLSFEQRKEVISEIWKDESRVKVITYDKLLVQYAQEHGIQFLVRGLRPTGDFDSEFLMASMNRKLFSECDTVFLAASENYYLSSTTVKEVYSHGGDISEFVPAEVIEFLRNHTES